MMRWYNVVAVRKQIWDKRRAIDYEVHGEVTLFFHLAEGSRDGAGDHLSRNR